MMTVDWVILSVAVTCLAIVLLVLRREQRQAERLGRELEIQLRRRDSDWRWP